MIPKFCYLVIFILTPSVLCTHRCLLTSTDIEGPYYHRGSPMTNTTVCHQRHGGVKLIVHGRVTDSTCNKGVQCLLDVWQANENAHYSNGRDSFECRSQIITDVQGHFQFSTIWPAHYDDVPLGFRPAHLHFKITPIHIRNVPTLTTQMYFKNDTYLGLNDPCYPRCRSIEPSLQTQPKLAEDGQSYRVKFNIALNVQTNRDRD